MKTVVLVLIATSASCARSGFWTGGYDATASDAAVPDAVAPDGALADTLLPDGALPDAAVPDAVSPDGALSDALLRDGALPDAAVSDAAPCDTSGPAECAGAPDFSYCSDGAGSCLGGVCYLQGTCDQAICNTGGPRFSLPDTNQRQCYDNQAMMTCPSSGQDFFGQDAQYGWDTSHAATARFMRTTPLTDEPTVLDLSTNLVWQGCAAGLGGNSCTSGTVQAMTWQGARDYCADLVWHDHGDWRLPDRYELQSIVDHNRYSPSIDVDAFLAAPGLSFWSSSSFARVSNSAWYVDFGYGNVDNCLKSLANAVRCVRSGP